MSRLDDLIQKLEAYPAPPEEAQARHDMLLLARTPADSFARDAFDPGHFTASGFVVSPDEASLLMIHHRRLDRWLQPGGHIDPTGEHVVDASMREIEEETGVGDLTLLDHGIFDLDIHRVPAAKGEPAHLHLDVRFLFRARQGNVIAADEVHDAAWVPLGEVSAMTNDRSVLRAVEKLRAR